MDFDWEMIIKNAPKAIPALAALGGSAATLLGKYWWDRRIYKSRKGFGIVNASLSTLHAHEYPNPALQHALSERLNPETPNPSLDGIPQTITRYRLDIDTLFENRLVNLLDNKYAIQVVETAARRARRYRKPLLHFGDDHWFIMNAFLCELSEQYSPAFLTKSLAQKGTHFEVNHVFALTYESWPRMKQGKIRLILVPEHLLVNDAFYNQPWEFHSESHEDRRDMIEMIRDDWKGERKCTQGIRIPIAHTIPLREEPSHSGSGINPDGF